MSLFSPCNFLPQCICPSRLSPVKLFGFFFLWVLFVICLVLYLLRSCDTVWFQACSNPSNLSLFPLMFKSIRYPNIREFVFLVLISVEWPSRFSVPLLSVVWEINGTAVLLIVSLQAYSIVYTHCIYVVTLSEKASIEESLRVNCYFMPRTFVMY